MINNEITLFDRLHEIVDEFHIDEVKKIIITLSKINKLKNSFGSSPSQNILYEKFSTELKTEFGITNFKIVHIEDDFETTLYKCGRTISTYRYIFNHIVINNIKINVLIDNSHFSEYDILCLNTYLKELVPLLYIQFFLINLDKSTTVDPLTQLRNRISFNIEMKTLVPLAIREKMLFGVLLFNIDRFRAVNDEHGDEFGDEFLKLYAKTIKENIRESDIAIRFGGGEFLVLLIHVSSEKKTLEIAEKIKNKLAETYLIAPNNDKFKKTVSVGVSMFPEDSDDINKVVKCSEVALGGAKEKGRNSIFRYKNIHAGSIEFF